MNPLRPPVSAGKSAEPRQTQQQPRVAPPWARELGKFIGSAVTITWKVGEDQDTVSGTLVALNCEQMACVVDTASESVFIRRPETIVRSRKHQEPKP